MEILKGPLLWCFLLPVHTTEITMRFHLLREEASSSGTDYKNNHQGCPSTIVNLQSLVRARLYLWSSSSPLPSFHMYVSIHVCICRDQKSMLGVFLDLYLIYWDKTLFGQELTESSSLALQNALGSPSLPLFKWVIGGPPQPHGIFWVQGTQTLVLTLYSMHLTSKSHPSPNFSL